MSTNFQDVAKYIVDKLVIALLVLAATVLGNFLLEKYKIASSVNIYDSNEFMRRVEALWGKAYEVEAEIGNLTDLYKILDSRRTSPFIYDVLYKDRDIQKEAEDKDVLIEQKLEEFFSLIRKNMFYIGPGIANNIIWYVQLALAAKEFERSFADRVRDRLDFDEKYGDEKSKKETEEYLNKKREELDAVKESLWKNMAKYRFTYGAARRYSLEYQP